MKKGYKKLLVICFTLIMLLIVNITFDILEKYTYILFLFVLFLGLIFLIGFERDKYLYKKDIIISIIITLLFYYVITYALGLLIGFIKNGYKLTLLAIIKNITPFIFIIILEELIRYNLIKKGSRKLLIMILVTILLILMDITLVIKGFNLSDSYLLVEFVLTRFLPSIFKNIFLTYAVYKSGYKTAILYRIIMELPLYFLPIFPKLGMYMESILKIVFPFLIWFMVYKMTKSVEPKGIIQKHNYQKAYFIFFIILMLLMILINCGWFKYYSLTIGSGSMSPQINKGDIIIVKKLIEEELVNLKNGDVLVFDKGDKIIVHRIVDIQKINNRLYFYTKGDANDDIDRWITEEDDIIGVAKFRIKYIGYPTVWLSEVLDKG